MRGLVRARHFKIKEVSTGFHACVPLAAVFADPGYHSSSFFVSVSNMCTRDCFRRTTLDHLGLRAHWTKMLSGLHGTVHLSGMTRDYPTTTAAERKRFAQTRSARAMSASLVGCLEAAPYFPA